MAGALIIGALALSFLQATPKSTPKVGGAVIPHHLLVANYIDQFYQKLSTENPDIQTVILLSPNHLGRGLNFMQTTDSFPTMMTAIQPTLDLKKIQQLLGHTPLKLEEKSFEGEHGIYNHLPYLKKYFPKAKLVPIILKHQTPQNRLDSLIKNLDQDLDDNTLIIASIDFTHYEDEDTALKNDNRSIAWLQNLKNTDIDQITLDAVRALATTIKQTNADSVAFDSPESMYVLIKLLNAHHSVNFTLFKRTSTLSLTKITDPLDNTSHVFGEFQSPVAVLP